MIDTSGPSSEMPFAYYDHDSSSLRTSQGTFLLDLIESSPTLPPSGSMQSGHLYGRRTLEPATADHGSSLSLPTPSSVFDVEGTSYRNLRVDADLDKGHAVTLSQVAYHRFLPTPTTDDAANVTRASGEFQSLAREMHNLLPTPQAHDCHGGKTPEQIEAMRNRSGAGVSNLNEVIPHLFPTPTTSDAKGPSPGHGGTTAEAIESLLGVPTSPPSDATSGPSDGQLPLL